MHNMTLYTSDDGTLYTLTINNTALYLSTEQYMLTDDYNGVHKNLKGIPLRLSSGVDFLNNIPGYHYNSDWTTVIPADGKIGLQGVMGVPKNCLVLVS